VAHQGFVCESTLDGVVVYDAATSFKDADEGGASGTPMPDDMADGGASADNSEANTVRVLCVFVCVCVCVSVCVCVCVCV
jgi:hypothetical protein